MVVATRETGRRTILGTDWAVENFVERRQEFGKVYWLAVFGLCNGVPDRSERFATKKAALEAAGIDS